MLSLSMHRAIELVVGLLLAGLSLTAGVDSSGAIVVCVVLGALLATVALSGDREGRSLGGASHAVLDRVVAFGLAIAAVALAVTGNGLPAALCAGAAVAESVLSLLTSYVVRPGRDDESTATTVPTS
jgi:hypothetical protein